MRKVIGLGETVLDIVFRNGQPTAAVPGGSTFNSMVSIGRCGIPADFLSEFGDDKVGNMIKDFMVANGVNPDYVNMLKSKTPLSLAFLDEKNDASYIFYRDAAEEKSERRSESSDGCEPQSRSPCEPAADHLHRALHPEPS